MEQTYPNLPEFVDTAYIEGSPLANAYNYNAAIFDGPNFTILNTNVSAFLCPSDAAAATAMQTNGQAVPGKYIMFGCLPGHGNYRSCMGPIPIAWYNGPASGASMSADQVKATQNGMGIYGYFSATTIAAITDGTSNTIAFSETAIGLLPTQLQPEYGYWSWCGFDATASGTFCTMYGINAQKRIPNVGSAQPFGIQTVYQASYVGVPIPAGTANSFHPGGANHLFGDGSVRFLKETIATWPLVANGNNAVGFHYAGNNASYCDTPPAVYQALSTRAGGEIVSADQF